MVISPAVYKRLNKNCKDLGIITRPNVGHGFWLSGLITLSYLLNTLKYGYSTHFEYKVATILSFGLFLQTIEIYIKLAGNRLTKTINISTKLLPGLVTSFLIWICLKQGIVFSLLTGFFPTFLLNGIFIYILKKLPKSFTLGEAATVVQGYVIFLYISFIQVPFYWRSPPYTELKKITAILEIGLLGVSLIVCLIHFCKFLRKTGAFYLVIITTILSIIVFPVTQDLPINELFRFVFKNMQRICITSFFIILLGITGLTVYWQHRKKCKSLTSARKLFHILIVLVYVPGLAYECTYLLIASGVILSIFIVLETARLIRLHPVYKILQLSVTAFIDEKDSGMIALTPMYLLGGCTLPLWLHACPCDINDSADLNYLALSSGILSVGIGDAAASYFGAKYGEQLWPRSRKSVEGTLANMGCQGLAIIIFIIFGLVPFTFKNILLSIVSIFATSMIEAKTDQVDNLVLPLVAFIIFSL